MSHLFQIYTVCPLDQDLKVKSVDLDEVAHYEPPVPDLHCLPTRSGSEGKKCRS